MSLIFIIIPLGGAIIGALGYKYISKLFWSEDSGGRGQVLMVKNIITYKLGSVIQINKKINIIEATIGEATMGEATMGEATMGGSLVVTEILKKYISGFEEVEFKYDLEFIEKNFLLPIIDPPKLKHYDLTIIYH